MKIWKWALAATDRQTLSMPKDAKILSVQTQGEACQLWALCDETAIRETRHFSIYGTGHEAPSDPGVYIGTFQLMGGALVFHVFEAKP